MRDSQPSPKDRSIPMTDEAMSPLRRRMIEDMTIRKLAAKTQRDYVQRIKNFAAFLGRSRTADGLALRPPFSPCPWRWTLTMVASTMAYSMSGVSEQALYGAFEVKHMFYP